MTSSPAAAAGSPTGAALSTPRGAAGRWSLSIGLLIGFGIVTVLLGVAVLVWPDATLKVLLVLFAIHLFVSGVVNIAQAVRTDDLSGGSRTLVAIVGALSLLVGFLVLRSPLQTLLIATVLIGALWLVHGAFGIVAAFTGPADQRVWGAVMGVVSVLAGGFVLVQPGISLATMVWVLGIWMIIYGAMAIGSAVVLRKAVHI